MNRIMIKLFVITFFVIIPFNFGNAVVAPHITGSYPEDGGYLTSNILKIYGYTFVENDISKLQVFDVTDNMVVNVEKSTYVTCEIEYWGDDPNCASIPGCAQNYCTLYVTLNKIFLNHKYQIKFLETTINLSVPDKPIWDIDSNKKWSLADIIYGLKILSENNN